MSESILQVENLSKYFGGLAAVSNCSLKIKKGSTGIWTRIAGFKVQSDNQLHHRTTNQAFICYSIVIPDGIWTRNLKIRSLTPYPLGHGDS